MSLPVSSSFHTTKLAQITNQLLYACYGERYLHTNTFPVSQTYSQYPLFSSATQLSPPLDSTSPTAASYFSDGTHNAEAFTHAPPYAASDTSNLDDILEDGDFAATAPSSGTASATEEEKRRRNQAASARFRQKKKAREAQMERSLKELAQKKDELELRCAKLEVENKFLKDLLTEKDSNRRERGSVSMVVSGRGKGKAAARDLDFGDDEMKEVDDRKDGVGTDF